MRNGIEHIKNLPLSQVIYPGKGLTSSVVIADEAHRLKEPKGQLGLAMKKIRCPSCFALTGTLIQNRLEEMWSVLDFVSQICCFRLTGRSKEVMLVL